MIFDVVRRGAVIRCVLRAAECHGVGNVSLHLTTGSAQYISSRKRHRTACLHSQTVRVCVDQSPVAAVTIISCCTVMDLYSPIHGTRSAALLRKMSGRGLNLKTSQMTEVVDSAMDLRYPLPRSNSTAAALLSSCALWRCLGIELSM